MLRSELISSLQYLRESLQKANILGAIAENRPLTSMQAFHAFSARYLSATPADRHLLKALKLDLLLEPEWWASSLVGATERPDRPERHSDEILTGRAELHSRVQFAIATLPQILEIIRPEPIDQAVSKVTLVIPERADQSSSPARIIEAIEKHRSYL